MFGCCDYGLQLSSSSTHSINVPLKDFEHVGGGVLSFGGRYCCSPFFPPSPFRAQFPCRLLPVCSFPGLPDLRSPAGAISAVFFVTLTSCLYCLFVHSMSMSLYTILMPLLAIYLGWGCTRWCDMRLEGAHSIVRILYFGVRRTCVHSTV